MQIVLIRFSSLGDVILQSPLLAWLKQNIKNCKITFITSEEFSSLVQGNKFIDEVITIKRLRGLEDIKQLKSLANKVSNDIKSDLIIDLHNTLRAKLFRIFCQRTPALVVYKRSFKRWLLVTFKINLLAKSESHHQRLIQDLKFIFNKGFDPAKLVEFIQKTVSVKQVGLTSLPESFMGLSENMIGDYLVISPVASFESKRWPIESVNQLITFILAAKEFDHFKIVIVAGPKDSYCQEILKSKRVLNFQGQTSLSESINLIGNALICISNDTGSSHIAEALGVSCITIFGPTSPSFGFRTHLKNSQSVSANVVCSPCSTTGKKDCSKASQVCMLEVTPEIIFEKIMGTWEKVKN